MYYLYRRSAGVSGPHGSNDLRRMARLGEFGPDDLLVRVGGTSWREAKHVGGLDFGDGAATASRESPYSSARWPQDDAISVEDTGSPAFAETEPDDGTYGIAEPVRAAGAGGSRRRRRPRPEPPLGDWVKPAKALGLVSMVLAVVALIAFFMTEGVSREVSVAGMILFAVLSSARPIAKSWEKAWQRDCHRARLGLPEDEESRTRIRLFSVISEVLGYIPTVSDLAPLIMCFLYSEQCREDVSQEVEALEGAESVVFRKDGGLAHGYASVLLTSERLIVLFPSEDLLEQQKYRDCWTSERFEERLDGLVAGAVVRSRDVMTGLARLVSKVFPRNPIAGLQVTRSDGTVTVLPIGSLAQRVAAALPRRLRGEPAVRA